MIKSEIQEKASFAMIRYSQCWEDTQVLLNALRIGPNDTCLSIGSAGDNTLAMLAKSPKKVIGLDLSIPQIALFELKRAAFAIFDYPTMLAFLGVSSCDDRITLFHACKEELSPTSRYYWDRNHKAIREGVINIGKFEKFFKIFRTWILPLIHSRKTVDTLMIQKTVEQRRAFYETTWNNRRWRGLFKIFFSRRVVGMLGRDPQFFAYVTADVPSAMMSRTEYALTVLDPSINPYLHWILYGYYGKDLPFYLRQENFEMIRKNLHKLEIFHGSIEAFFAGNPDTLINCFNLSDIFEYMSPAYYTLLYRSLLQKAELGARFAYWNLLADRYCPPELNNILEQDKALATVLHGEDQTFFYTRFVLETKIAL